jgi:membrane-associated phospholipid phosphatase
MTFGQMLGELQRRRVPRVLVGYGLAAWFAVESYTTIQPILVDGLEWTHRWVVLLALLGAPVAAVLAWLFDINPGGLERTAPREPGVAEPARRSRRRPVRTTPGRSVSAPVSVIRLAPVRTTPVFLQTRAGLTLLLAGVLTLNLLETGIEASLLERLDVIAHLRLETARAAHWVEGYYTFEGQGMSGAIGVVGFSAAYFIIFPLLLATVGTALARRADVGEYRVFAVGVALIYVISLPFFLFFPVAERWTYADSGAIVLSDLWSVHLIDLMRPLSALDNSFPSFHVSATVLAVLLCFNFGMRLRWTALYLGAAIVTATFALGIHWLMDIVAGAAAGVLAVVFALRVERVYGRSAATLSLRAVPASALDMIPRAPRMEVR